MQENNKSKPLPVHYLDVSINKDPFAKLGLDFFLKNNRELIHQWDKRNGFNVQAPIFWLPHARKWVFDDRNQNHERDVSHRAHQVR